MGRCFSRGVTRSPVALRTLPGTATSHGTDRVMLGDTGMDMAFSTAANVVGRMGTKRARIPFGSNPMTMKVGVHCRPSLDCIHRARRKTVFYTGCGKTTSSVI